MKRIPVSCYRSPYIEHFRAILAVVILAPLVVRAGPSMAQIVEAELAGKPLGISGYLNQSFQFGIAGNHYDSRRGFQAAVFQCLFETTYDPIRDVKFFGSASLNADWAYPILSHDDEWQERLFDQSRENLYILSDYETLLKELHFTWAQGDFVFRLGKQIVVWGETDGVRLMDQINPRDTRRGISDVEFETTIIPIWLLKSEYYPGVSTPLIQDLGIELVFNFNADFIADKGFTTGNNVSGIWAPNVIAGRFYDVPIPGIGYIPTDVRDILPPPLQGLLDELPTRPGRLGELRQIVDEPGQWDPDYFEYGLRIKTVIRDSIITLNGFYGRENGPVTRASGDLPTYSMASDGWILVEPTVEGFFPIQRFVGFTFSRDIPFLRVASIGGVAPMLRMEFMYAFGTTFVSNGKVSLVDQLTGGKEEFEKHDEVRYSVGMDFDLRIPFLNPRDSFTLSPQFIHRRIFGFPPDYAMIAPGGVPVAQNNYDATVMLRTTYFHNKLMPVFFWQHSVMGKQVGTGSTEGDLFLLQVSYEQSDHWNYTLQMVFAEGDALQPLDHKDNIVFTVAYRY
jgi:hypothetical protein